MLTYASALLIVYTMVVKVLSVCCPSQGIFEPNVLEVKKREEEGVGERDKEKEKEARRNR